MKKGEDQIQELVRSYESAQERGDSLYMDMEDFLSIIEFYLQSEELDKAFSTTENASSLYPFSQEINVAKAQVHRMLFQYDKANEIIDNVLSYQPFDPEALFLKGTLLVERSEIAEGLDYLEKAKDFGCMQEDVHLLLGNAYEQLEKYEQAIKSYLDFLEIHTDEIYALHRLLHCIKESDTVQKHLHRVEKLTDIDPYNYQVWYCLGGLYYELDRLDKAISSLDFSIAIEETFTSAYYIKGRIQIEMGNEEQGLETLAFILGYSEKDENPFYTEIGEIFFKARKQKIAIKFFRKATDINQFDHRAWYMLGKILQEKKRWFESIHFLKNATKYADDDAIYWAGLAKSEQMVGNVHSAEEAYEKAIEFDPTNDNTWTEWAMLHKEEGDLDHSISIITNALEFLPDNAKMLYLLGGFQLMDGKYNAAMEIIEQALIIDKEKHVILYDLFEDLGTQKAIFRLIKQLTI